jgi:glycosyltransferase involved in cell wall biosynthesis
VEIVSARPQTVPGIKVHSPPVPAFLRSKKTFDADRSPNLGIYLGFALLALGIRRLLRRIEPDLVMAMTLENNGVLAMISGFHPVALWSLGHIALSVKSETSLVVRWLIQRMVRTADLVYTGEGSGIRRLVEMGCPRENIRVNIHGIDVDQFRPDLRSEELRAELGATPSTPVVLCLRALLEDHDTTTFVRAIPKVLERHPEARFVLVGGGPEWDRVQSLVREFQLENVLRCTGYLPYTELPRYLASADIYVDPVAWRLPTGRSWWGHRRACSMAGMGFTLTLQMAMASGATPVLTLREGLEEVLDESLQALQWRGGDADDLAHKLDTILRQPEVIAANRARLRRQAEEQFQWETNCLEVEETYLKLLRDNQDSP